MLCDRGPALGRRGRERAAESGSCLCSSGAAPRQGLPVPRANAHGGCRADWGLDLSTYSSQPGSPPYTKATHCAEHVAQRGADLFRLSSHTHRRGGRFWVTTPDGEQIYESFVYSDPVVQEYDPPILFESPDPAERTLTYCAEFNNGVKDDGSPDPRKVTKLSTMPERTTCTPVACTAGRIGAACDGADDDATCDSSPGAGDAVCDACAITAGVTENEMFGIVPSCGFDAGDEAGA